MAFSTAQVSHYDASRVAALRAAAAGADDDSSSSAEVPCNARPRTAQQSIWNQCHMRRSEDAIVVPARMMHCFCCSASQTRLSSCCQQDSEAEMEVDGGGGGGEAPAGHVVVSLEADGDTVRAGSREQGLGRVEGPAEGLRKTLRLLQGVRGAISYVLFI